MNSYAACTQKVKKILEIKERTKEKSKYHTNISYNYQTALKMSLTDKHVDGLKPLIEQSVTASDLL